MISVAQHVDSLMYFRLENLPNKYFLGSHAVELQSFFRCYVISSTVRPRKVVLDTLGAFSCTCICLPTEPHVNASFYSYACLGFFQQSEVSERAWVFIRCVFNYDEIYRCTQER